MRFRPVLVLLCALIAIALGSKYDEHMDQAADTDDINVAIYHFKQAVEAAESPMARDSATLKLAGALKTAKRYIEALEYFSELDPRQWPAAARERPRLLISLCRLDEAEEDISVLRRIDEELASRLAGRVRAARFATQRISELELAQKTTSADYIKALSNLATICSLDSTILKKAGRSSIETHDPLAMVKVAKSLQAMDEHSTFAKVLRVFSVTEQGDVQKSLSESQRLLATDPDNTDAVAYLRPVIRACKAILEARMKTRGDRPDLAGAHRILDTAVRQKDRDIVPPLIRFHVHYELGKVSLDQGSFTDAEQNALQAVHCFDDALESDGQSERAKESKARAYLLLSEIQEANGDTEPAQQSAQAAAELAQSIGHRELNQRAREALQRIAMHQQQQMSQPQNMPAVDYYKTLGVAENADEAQIKKAYRKLAKEYHPDSPRAINLSDAEKERRKEKYIEIADAWTVLGDAEKRKEYDRMKRGGFRSGGARMGHPGGFNMGGGHQGFNIRFGGPGGARVNLEDIFNGFVFN